MIAEARQAYLSVRVAALTDALFAALPDHDAARLVAEFFSEVPPPPRPLGSLAAFSFAAAAGTPSSARGGRRARGRTARRSGAGVAAATAPLLEAAGPATATAASTATTTATAAERHAEASRRGLARCGWRLRAALREA
jgi:hypothetical protein